jgi:hypothetical protein
MIKLQKVKNKIKKFVTSPRVHMFALMAIFGSAVCFAQNQAGNYEAGTTALTTVTEEIAKYVPIVVKLCYAIAGVVAVVGAISVYVAMNNDEQDVKNILVLSNSRFFTGNKMKDNTLNINSLKRNWNFQIFARPSPKNI